MNSNQLTFWDGAGKIQPSQLYKFLETKGIGLYHADSSKEKGSNPKVIQVVNNLVNEVSESYLINIAKQQIKRCIDNQGNESVILDSFHKNTGLFSGRNLFLLPKLDIKFIEDTRDKTFFFFRNGVVEVTSKGCTIKKYEELTGCVWENNIIDREVNLQEHIKINNSVFYQFLRDITYVADRMHWNQRTISLATAIGYLLNRYKNEGLTKSIILMDEKIDGVENGGTGKTLLAKAINQLRNLHIIDGKFYDSKQWFQFDRISLATEVVLFDDIDSRFDFSKLFSVVTTGLEVKQRYKDSVYIPYEKSPKIMLTTNYAINGAGSSFKRRAFEFEVSHYYSDTLKPDEKFGHLFFEDWKSEEYDRFYALMFWCTSLFHKKGLFESEPINIKQSKLLASTCEEFIEFADDYLKPNVKEDKASLFLRFTNIFPEHNHMSRRTFTDWLKKWGEYKGYRINETHSNKDRFIQFDEKPQKTAE